ncbi:replicative DNA helicase [Clostridium swellfunianum]|uniref:replicative DNA helicase n=1 Tax=Clostridium swellfunianum TaxID=1367462 RepID=UPI00202E92E5|nr:replicative DNA helicase [Clostridium swellfunianum]MCM0648172.1 replicative DNA helicase [Clostridium swellfunianum]
MSVNKFVNQEAEMEVLGSVFLDNKVYKDIIDILTSEDFYSTANGIIFNAMKRLYLKGSPIDATTVVEELGTTLGEVGGVTYIAQLVSSSISASRVMAHCSIVKNKSRRRRLFKAATQFVQDIRGTDKENEELMEYLLNEFKAVEFYEAKRDGSLTEGLDKYIKLLEQRQKGDTGGYATGLKLMDNFSGGFQKQDLVILAARPSMGKSAVALNIAANMAVDNGLEVAMFQLEMSKISTIERLMANRTSIDMSKLKKGAIEDEQWMQIVDTSSFLHGSSLSIYDDVYTLKEIRSECKRLKLKSGLDVVFIDYLQLIDNGGNLKSRNEDVSAISRGLKLLAKELDITVVALSQLSRAPETRNNKRPYLSDLRDSGSIEQDADIVMFLYRDDYYDEQSEDAGFIEIIIAKHRNGETGTIKAKWYGKYQKVVA